MFAETIHGDIVNLNNTLITRLRGLEYGKDTYAVEAVVNTATGGYHLMEGTKAECSAFLKKLTEILPMIKLPTIK